MTEKQMLSPVNEEIENLAAEIRDLKQVLSEALGKLNQIESMVQRVFPSALTTSPATEALSASFREDEDLAAMANDPQIQAEIAKINQEFAVAEMDGLSCDLDILSEL